MRPKSKVIIIKASKNIRLTKESNISPLCKADTNCKSNIFTGYNLFQNANPHNTITPRAINNLPYIKTLFNMHRPHSTCNIPKKTNLCQ